MVTANKTDPSLRRSDMLNAFPEDFAPTELEKPVE